MSISDSACEIARLHAGIGASLMMTKTTIAISAVVVTLDNSKYAEIRAACLRSFTKALGDCSIFYPRARTLRHTSIIRDRIHRRLKHVFILCLLARAFQCASKTSDHEHIAAIRTFSERHTSRGMGDDLGSVRLLLSYN